MAWLCGNTHELLEAYFGVLLAGGVLLPLNIRLAPAELRADPRRQRAVVLFRHPDQPDPGHAVRTVVLGDEHEALLAAQPAGPVARPPSSTSTPPPSSSTRRGPPARRRARCSATAASTCTPSTARSTMGLTGDDVFLHTIPLFHVNGWGTPHFVTGLGGVHVMLPRFDAGEVLRLVEAHGVTRLFLVPAMARLVLDHPSPRRRATCRACARSRSGARRPARRCSPSSRTPSGASASAATA